MCLAQIKVIVLHVPGLVAPSFNCLGFENRNAFEKLIKIGCVEADFREFLFWRACVRNGTVEHARRVMALHLMAGKEKFSLYLFKGISQMIFIYFIRWSI